jgi:deoxycytidine triphosphate deaminase/uncharacterized coiled-coil protein SlyX
MQDTFRPPPTFATSHDEAQHRFESTCKSDPFPEILPALLNSADIADYVRATGMLHPFSPERIKSASCPVRIGKDVIYWENEDNCQMKTLAEGESFQIHENSILFVTTLEKFRLPSYIAIRFNLHIEIVHRGLLLGTGPIVDPGFEGHLLIPLHNLTTNTYHFKQGEDFIWVEFTKISPNPLWERRHWREPVDTLRNSGVLTGEYREFPDRKKNLSALDYLHKARNKKINGQQYEYRSITSSIPAAIASSEARAKEAEESASKAKQDVAEARNAADAAKSQVTRISDRFRRISFWSVVGAVIAGLAMIVGMVAMYVDIRSLSIQASTLAGDLRVSVAETAESVDDVSLASEAAEKRLDEISTKIEELSALLAEQRADAAPAKLQQELDEIRNRVEALESEVQSDR